MSREPTNKYERAFQVLPSKDLIEVVRQFCADLDDIQVECCRTVLDSFNHHPLCVLYAQRIAELTCLGGGRDGGLHEFAWHVCRNRVGPDYEFPSEMTLEEFLEKRDPS